jgi:dihydrofolate synthase/folylpolyglutamate synthase
MLVYDHPVIGLPKYGDGVGLHRVQWMLSHLGIDEQAVLERSISITGSNGKGSTAKICAEVLGALGSSVGLFTSPHLYRYNERFSIDGAPVEDLELIEALDAVNEAVEAYRSVRDDRIGAFEAQFVAALWLFSKRNVDWMILEAGIGGRYDPVRVARSPVVGLVSVDLEHTELLGSTLGEIAFDKLDAAPAGSHVVCGASCQSLGAEILTYASLKSVAVEMISPDDWVDRGVDDAIQTFDVDVDGLRLEGLCSRLLGRHQLDNHAVALRLCRRRLELSGVWDPAAFAVAAIRGVGEVRWPGRLEQVCTDPPILVDVGHSPGAVQAALAAFLAGKPPGRSILVTGVSRNKNACEILDILAPRFDRIICTAAHHYGTDADEIARLAAERNGCAEITACPTITAAVAEARSEARRLQATVYVAGGLFLSAEFVEALRGREPEKMRFF